MQSIRTVFICLGRWPSPGADSLEAGSALRICFPYLALIIQQISLCCKAKGWNKPGCFTARFSKPKAEELPPSPPSLPNQIAVLLVPLAAQGEVSNWLSILLPSPPRSPSEPPQVCADGQRVVPWPVGSTVAAPGPASSVLPALPERPRGGKSRTGPQGKNRFCLCAGKVSCDLVCIYS